MPYSDQFQEFLEFKKEVTLDVANHETLASASFLASNYSLIEQEAEQLSSIIKRDPKAYYSKKFMSDCRSYLNLLKKINRDWSRGAEVAKYEALLQEVEKAYSNSVNDEDNNTASSFFATLQKKIADDLRELASVPWHTAKIKSWVGLANITRLQMAFSRLVVRQFVVAAVQLHWFDYLEGASGHHLDGGQMFTTLNAPTAIFNALSVGFFAIRLIINMSEVLKHTLMPTLVEQELTMGSRFWREFDQRHIVFINDLVWGTVNGLTNYADYFKISAPVANWMLVGFLFFDVALLLYGRQLAEQRYLLKLAQYTQENQIFQLEKRAKIEGDNLVGLLDIDAHCRMLQEQITELQLTWHVTNAKYYFNAAAAVLLMSSFSASLLFAPALAAPLCFFISVVAIAMYLSADAFGNYYEQILRLQQYELREEYRFSGKTESSIPRDTMLTARNFFIATLTKNTLFPILLIATVAVSLPAAVILLATGFAYEFGNSCRQTSMRHRLFSSSEGVVKESIAESRSKSIGSDNHIASSHR